MDEILRRRIERKLDGLPEDKAYQVLDYIEFLESKYGAPGRAPGPLERVAEGVGDTLRAARLPAAAIEGTMNAVDSAARLMRGLLAAGRAAVEELRRAAQQPAERTGAPAQSAPVGAAEPGPSPASDSQGEAP
jgi:hypothetical protein